MSIDNNLLIRQLLFSGTASTATNSETQMYLVHDADFTDPTVIAAMDTQLNTTKSGQDILNNGWPINMLDFKVSNFIHIINGQPEETLEPVADLTDYFDASLVTIADRNGVNKQVLRQALLAEVTNLTQTFSQLWTDEPSEITDSDVLIRYWMKLPADFLASMGAGVASNWRSIFAWKTESDDYRVEAYIRSRLDTNGGKPYFHLKGDTEAKGSASGDYELHWEDTRTDLDVPIDEWFLSEFAWSRTTGRITWKINGNNITNRTENLYGDFNQQINRIFPFGIYTRAAVYPAEQWVDDVEIYSSTESAPVVVDVPQVIGVLDLPGATVGVAYFEWINQLFTGGTIDFFNLESGTLPTWVTFNQTEGYLSGTPDATGAFVGISFSADNEVGTSLPTNTSDITTVATVPVLTLPTATVIDSTSISGTVTTDTAGGKIYWYASTNGAYSGIVTSGTQDVTASGIQTIALIDGLEPETEYYILYVHSYSGSGSILVRSDPVTTSSELQPVITLEPTGTTVSEPTSFTLTMAATNTLSYQWYYVSGDGLVPGGTSASLTVDPSVEGTWGYYCVVTNVTLTAQTIDVFVTVNAAAVGTAIYNTGAAQTLTSPNTTYYFAEDITSNTDGIILAADNITIDGNFKTLTFGSGNSSLLVGIRSALFSARSGITIHSANVKHVGTGSECVGIGMYGDDYTMFNNSVDNEVGPLFQCIGSTENEHRNRGAYISYNYLQDRCPTNVLYGAGTMLLLDDRDATAYAEIHHNKIVEGHKGIVVQHGLNAFPTQQSLIYENQVSTNRIGWAKSAYCIASGKGRNILFQHNRCSAWNGRGVTSDGFEDAATEGATYNTWNENAIGANYFDTEKPGVPYGDAYENVYGMRARFASHHYSATNNNVICTSQIANLVHSAYIGSDTIAAQPYMNNLTMSGNVFISNEGNVAATYSAFKWQTLDGLVMTDNEWQQETGNVKEVFGWVVDAIPPSAADARLNVTETGTISYAPASTTPAQVTGLVLQKFFDTYFLEWNESAEGDVWAYQVYIDGVPEPELMYSARAPNVNVPKPFFYDVDQMGTVIYTVAAVTLTGTTGTVSTGISTTSATNGWQ